LFAARKRAFTLSTGTGIAPFGSLVRDLESDEKFDQLVLTHTCRKDDELQYGCDLIGRMRQDPLVGDMAIERLLYLASTTQEDSAAMGRVTKLIDDGTLFSTLAIDALDPEQDRVVLCGSLDMINDLRTMLEARGFEEGSNSRPSTFAVERAFVDWPTRE